MQTGKARDSNASRARILEAAKQLFTEKGFDGTTVRAIAEHAQIHPSLVMRYFDNKENLFLVSVPLKLNLPSLAAVPQHNRGRVLIRHFLMEWEAERPTGIDLPAMLRVALSHPNGPELLLRVFKQQVAPSLRQAGADSRAAALIATQTLGLALTRYVLKLPPVVKLSVQQLEDSIGPTLQRYLDGE